MRLAMQFETELEQRLAAVPDNYDHIRVGELWLWCLRTQSHTIKARDRAVLREQVYQGWQRFLHALVCITTYIPKAQHHKVDDCMELASQKCSCGEWFSDYEFGRHIHETRGSDSYYPFGYRGERE